METNSTASNSQISPQIESLAEIGTWTATADGQFTHLSAGALKILQQTVSMPVETFTQQLQKNDLITLRANLKEASPLSPFQMECELLSSKTKNSNWVEIRGIASETLVEVLGTVADISERKAAESQLQHHQENLEKLIQERTCELQEANSELESFAYSVSHDLRAPLRNINGFSQALKEDFQDQLDEDGNHYLNRIQSGIQKMYSLIDDILQLSRIGRQGLSCQQVDLSKLIIPITHELKESSSERIVSFNIEKDMTAYCDKDLMRIALQNLIDNAWKYSSKNTDTEISIHSTTDSNHRTICVEDNGVGFNMEFAAKLFAPFQRLHKPDQFKGNGIGLATVLRIAHKHKGSIWAESAPDEGSRFYLKLPLSPKSFQPTNEY